MDDESWEEASDIFEVRSEAGGTEPEEPEVSVSDEEESTIIERPPVSETNSRPSRYRTPPQAGSVPIPARRSGMGNRREENSRQNAAKWLENSCPQPGRTLSRLPRGSWPMDLLPSPHAAKSERVNIKPPKFEGKDSCVESHLAQFEIIVRRNRWDDSEKADYLKCSLTGEANHLLRDLNDSATYEEVVHRLRQRYGSLDQMEACRLALKSRRRKPGETLQHLMKDIRRLFLQAYPGQSSTLSEIMARDAFVNALQDRDLIIKVMEREPTSLDQAFKIAERMELYKSFPVESERETKVKSCPKVRETSSMDDGLLRTLVETQQALQQSLVESQKSMQKQIASLTEALQKEKVNPERTSDAAKGAGVRVRGICHYCRKPGHYRPECPDRLKAEAEREEREAATTRTISSRDWSSRFRGGRAEWRARGWNRRWDEWERPYRIPRNDSSTMPRYDSRRIPRNDSSTIPRNDSGTIPRNDSSTIPRYDSSTIPRNDSGTIPRNDSSTIPRYDSSTIPRYDSSTIPRNDSSTIPRNDSSAIPRYDSSTIPRYDSSTIPRNDSSAIPRYDSSTIPRYESNTIPRYDSSASPRHDSGTSIRNSSSAVHLSDAGSIPVQEYYDCGVERLGKDQSTNEKKHTGLVGHSETGRKSRDGVAPQVLTEVGQAGVHFYPETDQDEAGVRSVGKSVYIELVIGNSRHKAMLDTGSDVTLIPAELADMSRVRGSNRKLRAANGTLINLLGEWKTTVRLENFHLSMEFLVSDQIDEILIGMDWMRAHRCQLLLDSMTLSLHGRRLQLIEKVTVNRCLRLELQREVDQRAEILTCNNLTVKEVVVLIGGTEQQRFPNQCDLCHKVFTRPAGLRQHKESVHLNVTWPCQICGEGQSSRSNLTRHYKRIHPGVRNVPEPRREPREERRTPASATMSEAAAEEKELEQKLAHIRRIQTEPAIPTSSNRWRRATHAETSDMKEEATDLPVMVRESDDEATKEKQTMATLADQNPITAMKFQPLKEIPDDKESMKLSQEWRSLATRWAERVVELPPDASPRRLLPEFLAENPSKQWEGEFMLASMGAVKEIWRKQQSAATGQADDPPMELENEERVKAYLTSLQAQDISPVASESEGSDESKLCLEDVEDIVNQDWIVVPETPLAFEEDVLYVGGECDNEI